MGLSSQKGQTLSLEGEANDYFGKGLSGGKLTIRPFVGSNYKPHHNVIIGNTSLYGATSGEAYISGLAGERFAVRNSGASAVVEGVGDHACEYMTGGTVVILGPTGKNFAAGMSGGVAYVFDEEGKLRFRSNHEMVDIETLDEDDMELVHRMVARHFDYTNSPRAKELLEDWNSSRATFLRVMPREYRKVVKLRESFLNEGMNADAAALAAFNAVSLPNTI